MRCLPLLLGCLALGCTPPPATPTDAAPSPPSPPSAAAPSAAPASGPRLQGPRATLDAQALARLSGAGVVQSTPPGADAPITWRGAPLSAALERVIGADWRRHDELQFTCVDGYQPVLPVAAVQAADPWLVWARADGGPFELRLPGHPEPVALGPLYVVWPRVKPQGAQWPYQVTQVAPIQFTQRFPGLVPDRAAAPPVHRGFAVWRKQCHKCHRLNGQGGTIGPELNRPVSVVHYWRPGMLRRWIRAPQSLREGSPMPPVPLSDDELDALLAYLRDRAPAPPGQAQP